MAGFGDLMAPQSGAEPETGSWSDLVKDPVARSALLGFGMQMMTGGWGNGTQQLAAGLGAGATSAAGTSEALQKQLEAEDKAASAEANQGANRANSLAIAKLNADSRAEVAGIRTAAMLERTQLIQGAKGPDEMKLYNDVYQKTLIQGQKDKILTGEKDDQVQQRAIDAAQRALVEARAARARLPGASEATSQNGAVTGTGTGQGQTGTAVTGQNSAAQKPHVLDQALADPKMGPIIQQKLSTPEGQMELIQRNKSNKLLVEEWNKRNGTKLDPYATINGVLQRGR